MGEKELVGVAKLTDKQKLFIQEYLLDFNASRAAKVAGYSKKTAGQIGFENLKKPEIQNALSEALKERCERTNFDAQKVLQEHIDINQMDLQEILNDDFTLKPLNEWPGIWRRCASLVEIKEIAESQGDVKKIIGILSKIKWPDKLRNLELLGKHTDVLAYKDRSEVEHKGEDALDVLLRQIDGKTLGPPCLRPKKNH